MKPRRFRNWTQARKWLTKQQRGGKGRALHVVVLHDEWCTHGRSGACNCSPEFVVEDLTAENLLRGQQGQEAWLDRHKWN